MWIVFCKYNSFFLLIQKNGKIFKLSFLSLLYLYVCIILAVIEPTNGPLTKHLKRTYNSVHIQNAWVKLCSQLKDLVTQAYMLLHCSIIFLTVMFCMQNHLKCLKWRASSRLNVMVVYCSVVYVHVLHIWVHVHSLLIVSSCPLCAKWVSVPKPAGYNITSLMLNAAAVDVI